MSLENNIQISANVEQKVESIRKEAKEVVVNHNFSALELYEDLLQNVSQDESIQKTFENWNPDPLRDVVLKGGSDCFGLALLLQHKLAQIKIKAQVFPFSTKGLLAEEEARILLSDVGSVGVIVPDEQDSYYFVDPGFALFEPLLITPDTKSTSCKIDGRTFVINLKEGRNGSMEIFGDQDILKKVIDFRGMETLTEGSLTELQKQYLRIRPILQMEKFNEIGEKAAGIKIQMLTNDITIMLNNARQKLSYEEWNNFDSTVIANQLGLKPEELHQRVATIINNAPRIRSLWVNSLRKLYVEKNYAPLQENERNWDQAKKDGYSNGGVVVMLKNKKNELLMYRVPESRQKPHIGRFVGQYNVCVETADDNEEYKSNLARAFQEELGLNIGEFANVDIQSYRETDYGLSLGKTKTLARCVVCEWTGDLNHKFSFQESIEGGRWEWIPINEVMGHDLDPNLRPILEQHILEGLL
jgi:hypothetical protein